jgi:hypothetical protein
VSEDLERQALEAELEEERKLRARVHRWFGVAATVLVVLAIVVAVWRLNVTLGQSGLGLGFGESLGGAILWGLPWVVGIILVGVLFSMGTTRIMLLLDKFYRKILGDPNNDE